MLAEAADMALPMPLLIQTVMDGDLQDVMFMSLLRGRWEDGRLRDQTSAESPMALARDYEYVGPDSTTIRFHLRSDVRWSDGQPVTARDVVWTYEAMRAPKLPSPRRDYVEHLDSVTSRNDTTVTFHFRRRYPEMLFHTGHGIVPRHIYDGTALDQLHTHASVIDPAEGLVVSGAFRVARWDRGQQIVLEPNPYFLPRPHLERIVIRVIPDETTRLVELRTGNIDAMRIRSPANIPLIEDLAPRIRLERIARRFNEFVAYNPEFEPFADAGIRRALGLAIDVPAVMEALSLAGYAQPAASVYSPIFAELQDAELAALPYDPGQAREILETSGWVDDDGDGIREKDGRRLRFVLTFNAGNQQRADLATMLQSYWRKVGVEARLQQQEFQTFSKRLFDKDFEAAIYGWQVPLSPDVSGMWAPDAIQNFVSYRNPDLHRLMQTALAQRSEEQAAPYWKATARMLARDQPYTWLYYLDQVIALRDDLRGPRIDTFGLYQNVWEWWIPASRPRESGGTPARAEAGEGLGSASAGR